MAWSRSFSVVSAALLSLASFASAIHYDVNVGLGGKTFNPEVLTAQVGDDITYHFFAQNHSVTQSTFAEPCRPQAGGFFSGFVPNPTTEVSPTTFTIKVNDTKPIWVYCGQTNGDHCQSGMVHSINAPATGNTHDKFKGLATAAQKPSLSPPDGLPVGGLRKLHIDVGFQGTTVFNPNNVTELPRTVVEFSFNPANHSVVRSSFDAPCQPLANAFSAPFVPTQQTPSGVTFEVTIEDTLPIWFYCAQTTKAHCQGGMVGSINAPLTGAKTFDAFKQLAAKAPPSNIQPNQPNVGVLKVNGTPVYDVGGTVFDSTKTGWDPSIVTGVPPQNYTYSPYMIAMAGGAVPESYGWANTISDSATQFLQFLQFLDNFLLEVLYAGYSKLSDGEWQGVYPDSITQTMGSMFAQALVQRSAYTDSLQHYSKPTVDPCKYNLNSDTLDEWLETSLTALTLSLGSIIDVLTQIQEADNWLVGALATALGAKSRMIAVINMMQNHLAASAPREVLIPVELALVYVNDKFVVSGSCGASASKLYFQSTFPALNITSQETQSGSGRLLSVTVTLPGSSGSLYMAWIGPWGGVKYSEVSSSGNTTVPDGLSGHVWIVLTSAQGMKVKDIEKSALSAMERVWVTDPWAH